MKRGFTRQDTTGITYRVDLGLDPVTGLRRVATKHGFADEQAAKASMRRLRRFGRIDAGETRAAMRHVHGWRFTTRPG